MERQATVAAGRQERQDTMDDQGDDGGDDNPTVTVNVSEEQLAQVRNKLKEALEVNKKMQNMVIQQKMRYFELQASIKAKQARVETHESEEMHRSRIVDQMKSQRQQFHLDQTQETFGLSKQVMVLDERIQEVQNAIANTQEEYKVHRKHIFEQEEKIKAVQEQITSCQVQIEILKAPKDEEGVDGDFGKISLMPEDDFIPTAQNSPRWEATGDADEISRLGHAVDLSGKVRQSRPSELLDLASCHLESLLPQADVDRIRKLMSPQGQAMADVVARKTSKGAAPIDEINDAASTRSAKMSPDSKRTSQSPDSKGSPDSRRPSQSSPAKENRLPIDRLNGRTSNA
jgi:hypothetical protein